MSTGDGKYKSALAALQHARITRTESHIEIYLDIPSKMLPDSLRVAVSKGYDLPVVYVTGNGTEIEWWTNGIIHNPFGGPSTFVSNLQERRIIYTNSEGSEVNDNGGPSAQIHKYGVEFIEEWTISSPNPKYIVSHREGGPAFVRYEYENPNKQTWLEFTLSRNDIDPAADVSPKFLNPGDQVTVFREKEFSWLRNGKYYNDGKSYVYRKDYGIAEHTKIERQFDMFQRFYTAKRELAWRNERGNLHRVDGPATIELHHIEETQKTTSGKIMKGAIKHRIWKSQWAINGKQISTKNVLDWCRKNRVVLRDGPCFDQSAFIRAEDELCFITDFLKLA